MNTPPPTPYDKPKKRAHWSVIVIIWVVVGIAWSCVQFLISEGTYRLGNTMDSGMADSLYALSDTVSWPASHLYDQAMGARYEETIQELLQGGAEEFSEDEQATLQGLLEEYQGAYGSTDFQEAADEVLLEKDVYPEVDLMTEYSIYGGICIAWGALIALLGSSVSLMVRVVNAEPERMS